MSMNGVGYDEIELFASAPAANNSCRYFWASGEESPDDARIKRLAAVLSDVMDGISPPEEESQRHSVYLNDRITGERLSSFFEREVAKLFADRLVRMANDLGVECVLQIVRE